MNWKLPTSATAKEKPLCCGRCRQFPTHEESLAVELKACVERNMTELGQLFERLNYQFKDPELLEIALCHRSVGRTNNERLEFLGDAILSFIMADELYQRYPTAKEGDMSRMRSALVNRDKLAALAKSLDIGSYLRLGIGEQKSGGQFRSSILADAMEAVIGALYLDSDIAVCRQCIVKWFGDHFQSFAELTPEKDAKSNLQEWLQAHKMSLPAYRSKTTGKAHAQIFHVTCHVEGLSFQTEGKSTSRRRAEQKAAQQFLDLLIEIKQNDEK